MGQVSGQHFQPDTPIVEYDRVRELLANDGTMVIDARTRQDYAAGHLPKAVSLPIFSGLVERRNATAKFTPTTPVIVYCQSSGCTWSDALAADLYHRGHHNVVIYRGGWRDWSQHAN